MSYPKPALMYAVLPTAGGGFSDVQAVTGLTTLFAFTDLSAWGGLLFVAINTHASNAGKVTIETSEDGTFADVVTVELEIPAQKQVTHEVTRDQMRKYYRLSADVNPSAWSVKWLVRGIGRVA